jgi:hypothetical protein
MLDRSQSALRATQLLFALTLDPGCSPRGTNNGAVVFCLTVGEASVGRGETRERGRGERWVGILIATRGLVKRPAD